MLSIIIEVDFQLKNNSFGIDENEIRIQDFKIGNLGRQVGGSETLLNPFYCSVARMMMEIN